MTDTRFGRNALVGIVAAGALAFTARLAYAAFEQPGALSLWSGASIGAVVTLALATSFEARPRREGS